IRMVLVSGKPISFQMNLYEPLYIPRPFVEPELFASLRPPVYAGSLEPSPAPVSEGGPSDRPKNRWVMRGSFGGGFGGGIGGSGNFQGGGYQGAGFQGRRAQNVYFPLQGMFGQSGQFGAAGQLGAAGQYGQMGGGPPPVSVNTRLTYEELLERRKQQQAAQD